MELSHTEDTQLLTISEAATAGSLSVSTLRRYEKQGLIEPMRTPGGQRRYRRSDVENLIKKDSERSRASA